MALVVERCPVCGSTSKAVRGHKVQFHGVYWQYLPCQSLWHDPPPRPFLDHSTRTDYVPRWI